MTARQGGSLKKLQGLIFPNSHCAERQTAI